MSEQNTSTYALVDSGADGKLEQLGGIRIHRPATLCLWKRRLGEAEWRKADAVYLDGEWRGTEGALPESVVSIAGIKLKIQLQSNGQIGLFPEHAKYLPSVVTVANEIQRPQAKVLSLFAYTGMATCYLASKGMHVTHVDMSQKANQWAKGNLALNNCPSDRVRIIEEDVIAFLRREQRRGNKYDIVIADPPSFSRVSKGVTWNLEEKLGELSAAILDVMPVNNGALFFSNHSALYSAEIVRNLVIDHLGGKAPKTHFEILGIKEKDSERTLPAGSLLQLSW
jgi:23S rRNA (cytosine1962-C5)-methyltransferase